MPWKISPDSRISSAALDRQMNNWELARLQRLERTEQTRPAVENFITVSRQVGVAGEDVAAVLAERLGWPVFGKKLLEAMAGSDSVRQRIYESMDERDLVWWQEALRSFLDRDFALNDYFHRLGETVLSLARQSPCVFVGRGCDLVLPPEQGLRVRLVAPLPQRINAIQTRIGAERSTAQLELQRIETDRHGYIEHHFRVNPEDPTRHDLVLNLGRMTTEKAVEVILAAKSVLQPVVPGTS